MLKTFIISFLVLLLVAGIALLAWTIVDAHQRQHNNRPRSKYWFARSMAASIGIIVPTRLVLSTPAFVTLLSLTIATLFVLRWWMHAGPLPYRKEPLAYFSLTLLALLIAATFAFIRPVDVVASAIAAIFFAGTAGASMLLKTGFLMGHTPQRYYRAASGSIIIGVAFTCLSPWGALASLLTGILFVIYGIFCCWYAHFWAKKTKRMLTERFSR